MLHNAELDRPAGAASARATTSSACFGCNCSAAPAMTSGPRICTSRRPPGDGAASVRKGSCPGTNIAGSSSDGSPASDLSAHDSGGSASSPSAAAEGIHGGPLYSGYGWLSGPTSHPSAAAQNSWATSSYSAPDKARGRTVTCNGATLATIPSGFRGSGASCSTVGAIRPSAASPSPATSAASPDRK